jgi:hypothetical protein
MNDRIAAWAGGRRIEPWVWAIALILLIVLVMGFFLDQRAEAPPASTGPQGYAAQMDALDTAYGQGKQARKKMLAHNIHPTRARCVALYEATAASELGSTELEAEVEPFYVAGCLD